MKISGPFTVELQPIDPNEDSEGVSIGRMLIAKRFEGGLTAVSGGQMLMARAAVEGSAGYVAIERVTGSLEGRKGSFVLQHFGLMTRGVSELTVTVVPDSGTGELEGLSGTMTIRVEGAEHSYEFDFDLPNRH